MRVAQVATLHESVPPQQYGGIERVVSYLTEELVRQGHDVTLFASGDSETNARLVATHARALRLDEESTQPVADHLVMLERVFRRADEFDVIHFHHDYLHFPFLRREPVANVTTMHSRLDVSDLGPLFEEYREVPLVSISNDQRGPQPGANWQATVHHGLPVDLHSYRDEPGSYLAFIGRASPEKGLGRAIEIAKRSDLPIRIGAKVGDADRAYFESEIEPLLDHPLVEFVGEIGDDAKGDFLGGASAALFPIDWPEPFGLVMIEAIACGTPVIAYRNGAVPEVMEQGRTGFVVTDVDEAVAAARRIPEVDRENCRAAFEERFTAERMARDYLRIYERRIADTWSSKGGA